MTRPRPVAGIASGIALRLRRRRLHCLAIAAAAGSCVLGCQSGTAGSGGGWFGPRGQKWSILCVEVVGAEHRAVCDGMAASLRNTPGIRPGHVFSMHEDDKSRSRLCYGEYYRRSDPHTGKLEIPAKMAVDLAAIKQLVDASGQRVFLGARHIPYPVPDVGDPRWDLRRVAGRHTLQVAVFFDTDDFHERKQAAAEYAAQLRAQGFEAYYHHGETASEVTVGSFGDDLREAAPEITRLREHFQYHLENGRYKWNHLDGERYRVKPMVVAVPSSPDAPW